jgi:16S rRNA G966 N2-methylase RsmD
MVEKARAALDAIRANVASLAPPPGAALVVAADVYRLPEVVRASGPYDIAIVAPPYPHFAQERERLTALLASLPALLAADGVVVVQSDAGAFASYAPQGLRVTDTRRMGRTDFTFLERA